MKLWYLTVLIFGINVFGEYTVVAKNLGDLKGIRKNKEELQIYLDDKKLVEDKTLTKYFGGNKTYVHPSKSLVISVDWDGKGGMLFNDKDLVHAVVLNPQTLASKHLLDGVFDYKKNFPNISKKIAADFIDEVSNFNCNLLVTLNKEAFLQLDDCIKKIGANKILENKKLFTGLLAYIGEYAINYYNCSWNMIEVDEVQWEPWLVDEKNREYSIFAAIYKELYNYKKEESSVVGAVLGELEKYKLSN